MCGIAVTINGSADQLKLMGKAIAHRGLISTSSKLGMYRVWFTWLPITDKNAPEQPYHAGDYHIWLNGYISNWRELAEKYQILMHTKCDTELLAKFIAKFHFTKLNELNGFFSVVAIKNKTDITCFTDRYGIKQLYEYSKDGTTFICSELKGIKAVAKLELCPYGVRDWKHSLGVMNPNTVYKGVKRIPTLPFTIPKKKYISYEEAKEKLRALFLQSIERNKTHKSNCVFLSGGIDSGIIAKHIDPTYCFSMDYTDPTFSETEGIKQNSVNNHITLMCNQHLFDFYKNETLKALDDLKAGSCYTNFAITELASKFCTVVYSGAGGDEFFGGYPHRKNKLISEIIKRTDYQGDTYNISHFDYDLQFLKAVLVVEDRMAGYHTMETRYPLLDNDLVDFALSLPDEYLQNKRILKDISGLDEKVLNSAKKGFSNPFITSQEWVNLALNYLHHDTTN